MLTATSVHTAEGGWSPALPVHLDGETTLVLVFGASGLSFTAPVFDELRRGFARSVLAGCSTAGEIAGLQVLDGSLSVAVVRFDHTCLQAASVALQAGVDSDAAGRRLAALIPAAGLKAVLLLTDGLAVNGSEFLAGLLPGLPRGIPVFGGLAGDGTRFGTTWVLGGGRDGEHGQPASAQVRAVGFYGDRLRVGTGCSAGWSDFGPQRRITRSHGNVLYELDHRPALDLYKEYLGELAEGLPASALRFPLSVRRPGASRTVVRTVLAVDEAERSLTFAGDVPQGATAGLMRANNEALIRSAADAGAQAAAGLGGASASLLLSISCIGRRLVLGERVEEEIEAVLEADPGASHVGFYSYGEISRLPGDNASGLHNQTMTVVSFAEDMSECGSASLLIPPRGVDDATGPGAF